MLWALLVFLASTARSAIALLRSRESQPIVEIALCQQLAVHIDSHSRRCLSPLDRAFWATLTRVWPQWRSALVLVGPKTVIRRYRQAFRGYWRRISRPGPGRPAIPEETKALIVRMVTENGWRARKNQAEPSQIGIHVGLTTLSRYLPKAGPSPDSQQAWMTFLRNRRDVIAEMDFFVVPTVRFTLLYVRFVLDHGRRRVLHCNVARHPSAPWVIQQLREAFSHRPTHRYLVLDNDAIFSAEVARSAVSFGIHSQRAVFQSSWQNGTAERFVGMVRRELLDHGVVLSEEHPKRLLREYVDYYDAEDGHTSMCEAPDGRAVQERPFERVRVIGLAHVGGLHHRYA